MTWSGTTCRQSLTEVTPAVTIINGSNTQTLTETSSTYGDLRAAPIAVVVISTTTLSSSVTTASGGSYNRTLPGGAIAGISVGVTLVVGLALAAIVIFIWRSRKRKPTLPPEDKDNAAKAELPGESKTPQVDELGHETASYESDAHSKAAQLDETNARAELEGDWRGWEAPATDR